MALRSHEKLILLCARTSLDDETRRQTLNLLQQPINWGAFMAQATGLGLAPLVYHSLRTIPSTLIPEPVRAHLAYLYYQNCGRNLLLSKELVTIVRLLKERRIECVPIKGVILAESVFNHRGLRVISDLDILIRKPDLVEVTRCLEHNGYERLGPSPEIYRLEDGFYALGLTKLTPGMSVLLDLHWKFRDSFLQIPEALLWQNLSDFQLDGEPVKVLSPELTLLQLTFHLHHHAYAQMKILVDVAETLRHYHQQLDWDKIGRWVRDWGMANNFTIALDCVSSVLGGAVSGLSVSTAQTASWRRRWLTSVVATEDWFLERRGRWVRLNSYFSKLFTALFVDGSLWHVFRCLLRHGFRPSVEALAAVHALPPKSLRARALFIFRPLGKLVGLTVALVKAVFLGRSTANPVRRRE